VILQQEYANVINSIQEKHAKLIHHQIIVQIIVEEDIEENVLHKQMDLKNVFVIAIIEEKIVQQDNARITVMVKELAVQLTDVSVILHSGDQIANILENLAQITVVTMDTVHIGVENVIAIMDRKQKIAATLQVPNALIIVVEVIEVNVF
jgi:hypothetical protein